MEMERGGKRRDVLQDLAKRSGKSNMDLLDSIMTAVEKRHGLGPDSDRESLLEAMRQMAPEYLGAKPFKGGPTKSHIDIVERDPGEAEALALADKVSVRLGTRKPAKKAGRKARSKPRSRKGK